MSTPRRPDDSFPPPDVFDLRNAASLRGSGRESPDGGVTRQAIRRGTFTSVRDLIAAIRAFVDGWNDRCQPFAWTKD
jgi:hypothetical protein